MASEAYAAADLRDTVQAGRGRSIELSLSYRDWMPPPALLIGGVTPEWLRAYHAETTVLGASLYEVAGAEVVEEGVVVLDGVFQYAAQLNIFPVNFEGHFRAIAARLPALRRIAVEEPVVLLTGMGHQMYGHWLVDFLPKLFLLDRAGHDITRLRYLLPADTPGFARVWLGLLGIAEDRLVVYDPGSACVACRRLLVPTALRFVSRASPLMRQARRFLLERTAPRQRWRLRRRREAPGTKKILISRSDNSDTKNRRTLAERAAFEEAALARGFERVRPERLSIPEQIALFRAAGTILGEYGSGLHGSLFAGPGTTVVALRDNGLELGFLQSSLDHALGHAGGYVIGSARTEEGFFSVARGDIDFLFDWLDWRGLR